MYSASHTMNGVTRRKSNAPASTTMVATYTATATSTSAMTNSVSRTASAVCMTLVVSRPANSSW